MINDEITLGTLIRRLQEKVVYAVRQDDLEEARRLTALIKQIENAAKEATSIGTLKLPKVQEVKEQVDWKPWKQTEEELKTITGPPCGGCKHWNPQPNYLRNSTGEVATDGVTMCHAEDRYGDFSCYCPKDSQVLDLKAVKYPAPNMIDIP